MAGVGPGPVRARPAVGPEAARRPRRRWRWAAFVLLGAALALYLARAPVLTAAGRFLDVSGPPEAADYVLVLGGGSDTRPFVAAALVKAGLARQVLVPAVRVAPEATDALEPSEHEVIQRVLRARGVPDKAVILLPGAAASTADEARMLAEFLDAHPDRSVAVVTSAYHTRRARLIFGRALGERSGAVRFVGAPSDGFDATNWWRTEQGLTAYGAEYVKLGFHLIP